MSRIFAYCRVSTQEQTTENQAHEIAAAGYEVEAKRIVTETISGSTPAMQRPGFTKLLDRMEEGDILVVTKIDRLGRNAMDVRATVDHLASEGVQVRCMALGGVDLTSSTGRMTMTVLSAVAEFERDLLVERTQSGLRRAQSEGKRLGRPSVLNDGQRAEIASERTRGASLGTLAKQYGVSRSAIQRVTAAKSA